MEPPAFEDKEGMLLWLTKQLDLFWDSELMWEVRYQAAQPIGLWDIREGGPVEDDAVNAALNLDYGPLVKRLRSGRASPELIKWVAGYIESGGFAKKKTKQQRITGSLGWLAAQDVPHIKRLWRKHYGRKRDERGQLHYEAIRFAALVRGLDEDEKTLFQIANYVGRSRRARQRVA
jgi:hypothetical protein